MCKIKEINFEVADRSRQAFGIKVIKVTFNSHMTKKKTIFLVIILTRSLAGNPEES